MLYEVITLLDCECRVAPVDLDQHGARGDRLAFLHRDARHPARDAARHRHQVGADVV